jgi:hypothetical protein
MENKTVVRVVNVADPNLVANFLATEEGKQAIIDVIRRHGDQIREMLE